ncbi:hypothetical protein ACFQI3_07435 [Hansschlegelia quercus]|uniref:CopL family metal-binding regulatory protein n=1 Tax=Hansschlegelia quercus TaxID=2528245 RepID=A0A4V6MTK1_9HYPH|nr:hypothetical protein [Hansschlegelia quercus]TBN53626.1 hypothetical protein EYR15_07405 [Hansschlegelia quercus]
MTVHSLLRLFAGLALAMFMASSWVTPSEAHAAQDAPPVAAQQASAVPTAKSEIVVAASIEQGVQSASEDCASHMAQPGSAKSSCCSNTCHAVISIEFASFGAVSAAVTVLPALPAPVALAGPTVHIKRPPRPSAALVG